MNAYRAGERNCEREWCMVASGSERENLEVMKGQKILRNEHQVNRGGSPAVKEGWKRGRCGAVE